MLLPTGVLSVLALAAAPARAADTLPVGALEAQTTGGVSGAALDQHVDVLVALQRLDHIGNERDPALSLNGLFRDSDLHAARKVMRSG